MGYYKFYWDKDLRGCERHGTNIFVNLVRCPLWCQDQTSNQRSHFNLDSYKLVTYENHHKDIISHSLFALFYIMQQYLICVGQVHIFKQLSKRWVQKTYFDIQVSWCNISFINCSILSSLINLHDTYIFPKGVLFEILS